MSRVVLVAIDLDDDLDGFDDAFLADTLAHTLAQPARIAVVTPEVGQAFLDATIVGLDNTDAAELAAYTPVVLSDVFHAARQLRRHGGGQTITTSRPVPRLRLVVAEPPAEGDPS